MIKPPKKLNWALLPNDKRMFQASKEFVYEMKTKYPDEYFTQKYLKSVFNHTKNKLGVTVETATNSNLTKVIEDSKEFISLVVENTK